METEVPPERKARINTLGLRDVNVYLQRVGKTWHFITVCPFQGLGTDLVLALCLH